MRKCLMVAACAATALVFATSRPASGTVVGVDASVCTADQPSVQVRVFGFKQASGTVGVSLYASEGYLKYHGKLRKVEVPVRSGAPLDICIAVPRPGRYALAVHHDLNGNNRKDRKDGGGYSRDPHLSIFNLRPAFNSTSFDVGGVSVRMSVQLMYVSGLTIGPARN